MPSTAHLSASQARRLALGAQGFTDPEPRGRVDLRHLRRVLRRVKALQIDSVNVLVRSHYLPLFSRLGPYPRRLLEEAAYERGELFEYWGHQASLIPMDLFPDFRTRMEAFRSAQGGGRLVRFGRENRAYIQRVLEQIEARGPLSAVELEDPGERGGPWWGWRKGKSALEWLFAAGLVTVTARRNFERVYDLIERVVPADVLARPTPRPEESQRNRLLAAAEASGVATARDLADYFRIAIGPARQRLAEMVADGSLRPARVEGWPEPAFLSPGATVPRRVLGRALLSPFDSLIWERNRTERLFGFRYRVEIYVPRPQRRFGYYVLPFLWGESMVGRVDLKADRATSRLLVQAAHAEAKGTDGVGEALTAELRRLGEWLGLESIEVVGQGDLAPALSAELRRGGSSRS